MKIYKKYLLLSIRYDGSSFNGWIIQKNHRTIQGELEKRIKSLTKSSDFKIIGASKTDSGVHALDQKVLLSINFEPKDLNRFMNALNKALPLDIRVNSIKEVSNDFNVRDVKEKEYEYVINDNEINIFTQRYELSWQREKIDISKLQNIFNMFIGDHEFFLFSGLSYAEKDKFQTYRNIKDIKVSRNKEDKVVIKFIAKGFIRYQIRMIVGSAIQCYLDNKRSSSMLILARLEGNESKNPFKIEPNGLILKKITY